VGVPKPSNRQRKVEAVESSRGTPRDDRGFGYRAYMPRTGRIAVLVILIPLYTWTSMARADVFAVVMGNERLTLTCDGPTVVDTPCSIGMSSSRSTQPVRFTAPGTRYRYSHLLKQGVEKVLENQQHPLRPSASDIQLLRSLALDKCHPADETGGISGDLLQLCIPQDSSSVVLFMRGLCDRCDFEPIVLKKQGAQ